jgi:hypothetical protein
MQDSTVNGKAAKLIAAHPHATKIKHESHVTDEDLCRPISCTLYKHAAGNAHTYIYILGKHMACNMCIGVTVCRSNPA